MVRIKSKSNNIFSGDQRVISAKYLVFEDWKVIKIENGEITIYQNSGLVKFRLEIVEDY